MSEKTNIETPPPMDEFVEQEFVFDIAPGQNPERVDKYLTGHMMYATRTKVQKAINDGRVTIDGKVVKASTKVRPNDKVVCHLLRPPPLELRPQNIPLDLVFEDEYLLVVNKPPGMCTHPGFGNAYGTLVNAVLYHLGQRNSIELEVDDESDSENLGEIFASDAVRPGIVHRLDKDTSGLLVITKQPGLHAIIQKQFHERTVNREYYAIVWGDVKKDSGTFEGDIGRSLRNRKIFSVVKKDGKFAITDYEVIKRFSFLTLVKVKLRTGRTHQIRVHFSHNNHPLLGDVAYGGDKIVFGGGIPEQKKAAERCLKLVDRQMLQARTLGFDHPVTGERVSFSSDLADDMTKVLDIIDCFS